MKVAGIDVSSKTVTLVIHRDGRMEKPCELRNTPRATRPWATRLRKAKVSRVCLLEANGDQPQGRQTPGLDPRQHPSGSNASKKSHLSEAGNRCLRIALYMPALSAARYDPNVRAF